MIQPIASSAHSTPANCTSRCTSYPASAVTTPN